MTGVLASLRSAQFFLHRLRLRAVVTLLSTSLAAARLSMLFSCTTFMFGVMNFLCSALLLACTVVLYLPVLQCCLSYGTVAGRFLPSHCHPAAKFLCSLHAAACALVGTWSGVDILDDYHLARSFRHVALPVCRWEILSGRADGIESCTRTGLNFWGLI